jgi:hypothetical protein
MKLIYSSKLLEVFWVYSFVKFRLYPKKKLDFGQFFAPPVSILKKKKFLLGNSTKKVTFCHK